jgi:hypothetical protein
MSVIHDYIVRTRIARPSMQGHSFPYLMRVCNEARGRCLHEKEEWEAERPIAKMCARGHKTVRVKGRE